MTSAPDDTAESSRQRQLTLFDSVCIVVGIIVGASIFRAPQLIAHFTGGVGLYFLAWLLGGAISLLGAVCFAELATRYPEHGGAYAYLRRAFGDRAGFLYGWTEFWLVRPGNVGAMALVFAPAFRGALKIEGNDLYIAIGVITVLTFLNLVGLRVGVWGQNLFTTAKVAGLLLVVVVGIFGALFSSGVGDVSVPPPAPVESVAAESTSSVTLGERFALFLQAMVFVMFAYGGWSDMAMVGAEVRDPKKNLFRSLFLGALAVTSIYFIVNAAYILRLGFDGVRNAELPAEVIFRGLFSGSEQIISGLICISCLGAIQGLIFTGARVQYAFGRDHRLFAWLGKWNETLGVPVRALLAQAVAAALLLIAAYFSAGRNADQAGNSFDQMVNYTGVIYWASLLAVAIAFLLLRDRDGDLPGYKTPWFPVTSLLFITTMMLMVYATVRYAFFEKLEKGEGLGWFAMAAIVFATGILLGGGSRKRSAAAE
jgi:APA family basic amino acid/polyamine antiporter